MCSSDLKRFKRLTLGHSVVMGRKTFDSILAMLKKPLPGRTSIVVSRNPASVHIAPGWTGVLAVASLEEALRQAPGDGEIAVIGGAQIYALALPLATRMYLTEVEAEVAGDAYFPDWDRSAWQETARETGPQGADGLAFDFVTYERRR